MNDAPVPPDTPFRVWRGPYKVETLRQLLQVTGVLWIVIGLYLVVAVTNRLMGGATPGFVMQLVSSVAVLAAFLMTGLSFFLLAISDIKLWTSN